MIGIHLFLLNIILYLKKKDLERFYNFEVGCPAYATTTLLQYQITKPVCFTSDLCDFLIDPIVRNGPNYGTTWESLAFK